MRFVKPLRQSAAFDCNDDDDDDDDDDGGSDNGDDGKPCGVCRQVVRSECVEVQRQSSTVCDAGSRQRDCWATSDHHEPPHHAMNHPYQHALSQLRDPSHSSITT